MIRAFTLSIATILVVGLFAGQAGAVAYGSFMDPTGTVAYNNVEDVNGLFGAPSVSLNSLDFTPASFESTCAGGCAGGNLAPGANQTFDQLTLDIDTVAGQQVTEIGISEGLDYSLQAFGVGAFASISVTANVFVDIYEVNQQSINGISGNYSLAFNPSNSFSAFGPAGIDVGNTFTGDLTIDIQALLAANGVVGEATGVRISFDNTLQAFHSGGGLAQVRKRDTDFVSLTINGGNPVPEPGTALLLGLGLVGLAKQRRN